ncbi:serine/threonine-protein kinase [Actinopolymorpha singaporensis]|uniref:Serine/threonine protein kinase n=1 Tax=Actinopolymorpha singaporensis TaxID=117157 RepID=A0A1H1VG62_9ACTN|nr:serine/threonine-protein kinase [Actinopolymorpha singaporensis]SDS83827.1 Serine/threonine protein kinase [Actinopolymorpha singaporensis]
MRRDLADEATTVESARLGGYVLHERVGQGGMGVVHRATDPRGRVVAVKLLRPHIAGDGESRARFAREARVLARVRGRHVAQVLDADVAAATPYLVTDFVAGPALYEVVDADGPLAGAELADLAGDLADALCSIHGAGVVHRDLKPGNVLLADGIAVVIDFGIAQIADDTRMTTPGLVYGTPGYVAPEILTGADVTGAADVHAWAATVAYASTGRPPFGRGPLEAVAYRVLHEDPDLTGCPEWLEPVLVRCFAKNPAERPTSAQLLRWLETGEEPPAPDPGGGYDDEYDPAGAYETDDPDHPETVRLGTGVPVGTFADGTYADDGHSGGPYASSGGTAVYPAVPREDEEDDRQDGYDETCPDQWYGEGRPEDPGPDGEGAAEPAAARSSHSGLPRASYRVVTALGFLTVGALAAVMPFGALAVLVGWLLVAWTVQGSAGFVERRRHQRGRRRTDPFAAAAVLPWHVVRAAAVTVLTVAAALVGAGFLAAVLVLFFYVGAISPRWDLACGVTGLVVSALTWWGIRGEGLQEGSRRILRRVVGRRRGVLVATGVVLAALTLFLVAVASGEPVSWWPLEHNPFPRLDWPG